MRFMTHTYTTNISRTVLLLYCLVPDLRAAWTICRDELPAVLLTQYKVWPAVNFINFTYVPEPLRVLVSGVVALFWNIYLTAKVAGGTM